MGIRSAVGVMVLAGGLAAGGSARGDTRRPDRPDAGPPLIQLPSHEPAPAAEQPAPGTPAPRALDSTRSPMPDRDALPKDVQDARLAPPTPPVPQTSGTKTGGGPARVKDIFHGQAGAGGSQQPRNGVTRTPEDQLAPSPPAR